MVLKTKQCVYGTKFHFKLGNKTAIETREILRKVRF